MGILDGSPEKAGLFFCTVDADGSMCIVNLFATTGGVQSVYYTPKDGRDGKPWMQIAFASDDESMELDGEHATAMSALFRFISRVGYTESAEAAWKSA